MNYYGGSSCGRLCTVHRGGQRVRTAFREDSSFYVYVSKKLNIIFSHSSKHVNVEQKKIQIHGWIFPTFNEVNNFLPVEAI